MTAAGGVMILGLIVVALTLANLYVSRRLRWAHRELQHSLAREKAAYANVDKLMESLNTTTANLEKQNTVVHELLAEKRNAWGLQAEDRLRGVYGLPPMQERGP